MKIILEFDCSGKDCHEQERDARYALQGKSAACALFEIREYVHRINRDKENLLTKEQKTTVQNIYDIINFEIEDNGLEL